jgi:5-azacytidine-induced protein 1
MKKNKDKDLSHEKQKTEMVDRFKKELKKEKEAWLASEKVRKEKWEMDKIREIREGTVQKLEPTIQNIIEKNKEELRK